MQKLNSPEKNNKPALFTFEDLSTEQGVLDALKTLTTAFKAGGAKILKPQGDALNAVVAKALKGGRESGIKFKSLSLTFDDGQMIELRVKSTGDFYKVLLNKKLLPIKSQDDHTAAIKEIIANVKANFKKFEAAMARKQTKEDVPTKTTTSKKQQIEKLTVQRDTLIEDIAAIEEETAKLVEDDSAGTKYQTNAEMAASTPSGQGEITDIDKKIDDAKSRMHFSNPMSVRAAAKIEHQQLLKDKEAIERKIKQSTPKLDAIAKANLKTANQPSIGYVLSGKDSKPMKFWSGQAVKDYAASIGLSESDYEMKKSPAGSGLFIKPKFDTDKQAVKKEPKKTTPQQASEETVTPQQASKETVKREKYSSLNGDTYDIRDELKSKFGAKWDGYSWKVPPEKYEEAQAFVKSQAKPKKEQPKKMYTWNTSPEEAEAAGIDWWNLPN